MTPPTLRRSAVMAALALFALLVLPLRSDAGSIGTDGRINFSSSGGLTQGAADLRYLKLAADNDPLTGALSVAAGSAAAPSLAWTGAAAQSGFWADASNLYFGAGGGTYRVAFPTSGTNAIVSGTHAISFNGGYVFTSGANSLNSAGLYFSTTQTTRAHIISAWTDAHVSLPAAGLGLWSGMDADGEYAVGIGTSASATAGMILLSLVGDADGTPTRQINFMGDGRALAGAGAVGTPTYSFLLDPNTGIYNSAADTIAFSSGGTLIATVASTGIVPGADASLSLGTSALSWDQIFAKTFADQAGTARFTGTELGSTTITSTTPLTAGADVGMIFTTPTDYVAAADTMYAFRDNTSTDIFKINGLGQMTASYAGTSTVPVYGNSGGTSGISFAGSSTTIVVQGVKLAQFDIGSMSFAKSVSLGTGADLTIGASDILILNKIRSNDNTAMDLELSTSATDGSSVEIFSGADLAGEYAVRVGSSDVTTGQINLGICNNCDAASPTYVAEFNGLGDLQLDGDLTISGGDLVLNGGNGYTSAGLLTVSSAKIGAASTTITETISNSTGAVDFASISADTCGEKTITVTGADVNDPVACAWPAALEANLSGLCFVSAADTVTFRLCNTTAVAIDPASATFGARTIK